MSNGPVNPLLPNPLYNLGKLYERKEEKELSGGQSCPYVEVATFITSYCWIFKLGDM